MSCKNYTVSELVDHPGFRRMVKGKASFDELEMWSQWIEENDQRREKARSAFSEIAGFEFDEPVFPDIEQQWSDLYRKTVGSTKIKPRSKRCGEKNLRWIFRAAAVILVMSLAGLGYYYYETDNAVIHLEQLSEKKTVITANDEQKTLIFSNGSRIILGSNSILTYNIGLLHNQTIDVTLEGKAWFDVESDPVKKQPVFAVNTPDGIIRDIGTKFLVTVQKEQSRVVLQEGLVEIEVANEENANTGNVSFSVRKGEMVEFNREGILKREEVNSTLYTSWATGFLEFNQTELQEFAEYIERRFNVKVQIGDTDLPDILIDGAVYFRSLEELVRSVSVVTGIPVYQSDDRTTVYLGNPNG